MAAITQVSQVTEQTFDRDLSLRIDAIVRAIGEVQAWPDSAARRMCLLVLHNRLRKLEGDVPA